MRGTGRARARNGGKQGQEMVANKGKRQRQTRARDDGDEKGDGGQQWEEIKVNKKFVSPSCSLNHSQINTCKLWTSLHIRKKIYFLINFSHLY